VHITQSRVDEIAGAFETDLAERGLSEFEVNDDNY